MLLILQKKFMNKEEQITFRDIDAKQIADSFSDNDEGNVVDIDEDIVYDEIVWDQQNVRLKKDKILLNESEKQILILLNKRVNVSDIKEIEDLKISEVKKIFQVICKKLCVNNQKEAYRRAKDLNLL